LKSQIQTLECDVAVIGGGMGGVAAALAAAESGLTVLLTEETRWIGGQITSQAVSALDEHQLVETVHATRSYQDLRERIRRYYIEAYHAPAVMPNGAPINPGNGWVSRLCFEPRVGLKVIGEILRPHLESGALRVLTQARPTVCAGDPTHIQAVKLTRGGRVIEIRAEYFLDATEAGDLLPLAGVPYITGAEAREDTGEKYASADGPHPERMQSFTCCFLVEFRTGEDHTIRRPRGYERFRKEQPYSLTLYNREGEAIHYNFNLATADRPLPFWTYRRVFDAQLLAPGSGRGDIALINWHGNDYHWANPIDQPPAARAKILDEAKRLSLGFLVWLQTEVARDDGQGFGYRELRLLPEAVGTRSGLAMYPYLREARRIRGLYRIVAEDILAESNPGKSQAAFADSVGIGWYAMDLHPAVGDSTTMYAPTLPFQIPLGSLIPVECDNLIAAGKNINTTHLSNGAYRLHPVEWSIGEAAGALAAFCVGEGVKPRRVSEDPQRLRAFQGKLLERGTRLEWPEEALAELK
jgi:hypothetical protein